MSTFGTRMAIVAALASSTALAACGNAGSNRVPEATLKVEIKSDSLTKSVPPVPMIDYDNQEHRQKASEDFKKEMIQNASYYRYAIEVVDDGSFYSQDVMDALKVLKARKSKEFDLAPPATREKLREENNNLLKLLETYRRYLTKPYHDKMMFDEARKLPRAPDNEFTREYRREFKGYMVEARRMAAEKAPTR
ncbi:MAG: hypothetical protein WAZ18_01110 [Alphaproteobacteria bacterium]